MNWPSHGGQPQTMKKLFNLEEEKEVLDFSANLNPLGPPGWLKNKLHHMYEKITYYPDPFYSRSARYLADYEGVAAEQILLTNGGAEAIFLAAKLCEKGKAIIVQPAFSEYERACRHYYVKTEYVFLKEQNGFQLPMEELLKKAGQANAVFLCRPNNPTGTVIQEESIIKLLEKGLSTGTMIVVDEAFADFLPAEMPSLVRHLAHYPNLIVLRSLTKMYTIPGLRIGYMIGSKEVAGKLQEEQMPWSINALADAVVPDLLADTVFLAKTRKWLEQESEKVFTSLKEMGFSVTDSKVNFYLFQDAKAPDSTEELFGFLFKNGILTRHTHNFPGLEGRYIRAAIRSEQENNELLKVLRNWGEKR